MDEKGIFMKTILVYCDKFGSWYINVDFDKDNCYFCKILIFGYNAFSIISCFEYHTML